MSVFGFSTKSRKKCIQISANATLFEFCEQKFTTEGWFVWKSRLSYSNTGQNLYWIVKMRGHYLLWITSSPMEQVQLHILTFHMSFWICKIESVKFWIITRPKDIFFENPLLFSQGHVFTFKSITLTCSFPTMCFRYQK
jgi:hypothetical protein